MHKAGSEKFKLYEHNDGEILSLNNRFLNLFARPMNERACFLGQDEYNDDNEGKWIVAECNGALYQIFEFALPKNSTIKRIDEETILIDTPRAKLKIVCIFSGSNAYVADKFVELYLGVDDYFSVTEHAFSVKIEVEFKPLSVFSVSDWDKYEWIDSFIKTLKDDLSEEVFLQKINWETALTMIQGLSNFENINTIRQAKKSRATNEKDMTEI